MRGAWHIGAALLLPILGCAATGDGRLAVQGREQSRPLYYERALTPADLDHRSMRELSLMRNWIFARAGQPFRREWLRAYFESTPWYRPGPGLDSTRLAPFDFDNAALIGRYELSLPRAELLSRRRSLMAAPAARAGSEDRIELALLDERLGDWESDPARGRPSPLQDPTQLDSMLTIRQLDDFSRRDLWLLRQMIEARRGRPFASESLQMHFERFEWYEPSIAYDASELGPVDRRNIRLILSLEEEIGGPLSEDEADRWYSAA